MFLLSPGEGGSLGLIQHPQVIQLVTTAMSIRRMIRGLFRRKSGARNAQTPSLSVTLPIRTSWLKFRRHQSL